MCIYLVDMYVRGRFKEQGRRQAKGCTQQATGHKEVQETEGDQDCCAHSQTGLVSQLLYAVTTLLNSDLCRPHS